MKRFFTRLRAQLGAAETANMNGNFERAIHMTTAVLETYPHCMHAHKLRALACWKSGGHSKSIALLRNALKLNPHNLSLRYNLACSACLLGDYDIALRELTAVFKGATQQSSSLANYRAQAVVDVDFTALRQHEQFIALCAGVAIEETHDPLGGLERALHRAKSIIGLRLWPFYTEDPAESRTRDQRKEMPERLLSCLPEDMGRLRHLTHLDLAGNELSDLPQSMEALHYLYELDVSNNILMSVPSVVSTLPRLESLSLARNGLRELPGSLSRLRHLKRLDVSGNLLTPQSLEVLAELPLQQLALRGLALTELPTVIAKLPKLEILDLSQTGITVLPSWLTTRLPELHCRGVGMAHTHTRVLCRYDGEKVINYETDGL